MQNHTKLIKKFFGSFLGVAGVSTFIGFPGLAQANLNSSFPNSSSQSILAQNTPGTTNPTPGPTSAPKTTNPTPGPTSAPGTTNPTPGPTSAPGTTNSSRSVSTLDKEFMTKAAQSDLTEIQTSQLALQRSQKQAVRDFAQMMIKEHQNSSKQLTQIANNKGVTLPKDIGQDNKALLTKLTNLTAN